MYNPYTLIKVLLLADSHIGFDYTSKPRVSRRRRGDDFFRNFQLALQPALESEVDLVVHGGDLFTRPNNPDGVVQMAMAPLIQVALLGIPVFLVPGNHERSKIPLALWSVHPNLYIFREPQSFLLEINRQTLELAGFPFSRRVREEFRNLLGLACKKARRADICLLCMHQAVEGAQVGPVDYTFKDGGDVIRAEDIPTGFAAVLSGHIHRAQRLDFSLSGERLNAPVIYPGSVERTAFAERFEEKGYYILEFEAGNGQGGRLVGAQFYKLPARPMVDIELNPTGLDPARVEGWLGRRFSTLNPEAVVRIRILDEGESWLRKKLTAGCLRGLAPASMNVAVVWSDGGKN